MKKKTKKEVIQENVDLAKIVSDFVEFTKAPAASVPRMLIRCYVRKRLPIFLRFRDERDM